MKRRQDTQDQSGSKQEPLATLLSPLFSRVETRQIDNAVERRGNHMKGQIIQLQILDVVLMQTQKT